MWKVVLYLKGPWKIYEFLWWSISQNYALSGEAGLELVCPLRITSPQSILCLFVNLSGKNQQVQQCVLSQEHNGLRLKPCTICYFGGARSKVFATLRNVSKLLFFDKIGQAKSGGFRFYSAIWRSESRISSRYLEITSSSLIYSLTFSRKEELLFWLSRGLNRLTCVTRQIRGDSKLRD